MKNFSGTEKFTSIIKRRIGQCLEVKEFQNGTPATCRHLKSHQGGGDPVRRNAGTPVGI
ncbi:MAG: hypothetical protein WC637_07875 [Victivallales bacterium]